MPLKVLTLNIWNDSGPWEQRRARIREWIDRLDPDLIGLQEVLRGEAYDQLGDLLDTRPYRTDFARAAGFWKAHTLAFGNAVASRWPITDREELPLPDLDSGETRCALSVTVDAPLGPICFSSTHLNWKYHHGYVRERQVQAVCDMILRRRDRTGFPPILAGDFNAEPESDEVRYVVGLHTFEGRSVAFRDAWRVAGDGTHGATWSNRNPYARVALEPERRIDYIFTGFPTAEGLGHILHCRVVCDDEQDGVWPSDHFGVYAELADEPLRRPLEP